MNPEIIKTELLVIGLETTTRAQSVAADVHAQGEMAHQLNLPAQVPNQIDTGTHLIVLWNWHLENDFQAMTAVTVSALGERMDENTTTIRKYYDAQRTGEIWIPMEPHLKPELLGSGADACRS